MIKIDQIDILSNMTEEDIYESFDEFDKVELRIFILKKFFCYLFYMFWTYRKYCTNHDIHNSQKQDKDFS